jgi:hypothetical protein
MGKKPLFILILALLVFAVVNAQTPVEEIPTDTAGPPVPAPPLNVKVDDKPNDDGHGVLIKWDLSSDDGAGLDNVLGYEVYRSGAPDGEYSYVGMAIKGSGEYEDQDDSPTRNGDPNPNFIETEKTYYYRVRSMAAGGIFSAYTEAAAGHAIENWFHNGKVGILVGVVIFWAFVVYFIFKARGGKDFYVRPLAGINAVDDAIGRATEMGRPILFVLGTGTAGDIATIAGFTILARVAKLTAEYQTKILVPVNDPVMMAVGPS